MIDGTTEGDSDGTAVGTTDGTIDGPLGVILGNEESNMLGDTDGGFVGIPLGT